MYLLLLLLTITFFALSEGASFSGVFSDGVVLQRGVNSSKVFGQHSNAEDSVRVDVVSSLGPSYSGFATLSGGIWSFELQATLHVSGETFTIFAIGFDGGAQTSTDVLSDVVFGDVFLCSGQSNMDLKYDNTYMVHTLATNISAGLYDASVRYD